MTPYTQEVEEALKPTAEQYDAARMLTEAAFSEDPHGRTMMVAKWIAARDAAELRRQSQELERAREELETIANGEVPENDPDQSFRDAVILFASHALAQPAQKQGMDR